MGLTAFLFSDAADRHQRTTAERVSFKATETFVTNFSISPLPVILLALIGWMASSHHAFSQTRFEMTPPVEQLVRSGQRDMYNCDYELANQKFDELVRRFPNHPIGYMYKAEVFWWVALRDKTNKSLENGFNQYTQQAIAKGEELLRNDPKDFHALLFLASTYGNKVRFLISISKRYVGALSPGKKGTVTAWRVWLSGRIMSISSSAQGPSIILQEHYQLSSSRLPGCSGPEGTRKKA